MKPNLSIFIFAAFLLFSRGSRAQISRDWEFRDEYLHYLENPADEKYVEDRRKLERLPAGKTVLPRYTFYGLTQHGDSLSVSIRVRTFEAKKHVFDGENIDGKQSYGRHYPFIPRFEIGQFRIRWAGEELAIPADAYANLYEPELTETEIYISPKKELLYVYLRGSDGADGYSVKWVFNRKGYVTRLLNLNECAPSFDFLDGHGSCD